MTASATKVTRWAMILLAPLAVSPVSTLAFADDVPTPPKADAPPGPASSVPAAPPPVVPPLPASGPLGFIERVPPSGFPTDPVRGIYGGSLWSTFHGQQWPYYPKTGIAVSGYVWLDSGYETINRNGGLGDPSIRYWLQQGRFLLRVTPTWSDGKYFVQGQAELVAEKDQSQAQPFTADTDDIWIKAGQWKSWDFQFGRFEAWEIYHFGMGLDLYTLERNGATDAVYSAPTIYGVTYAFYRPQGVGAGAFHYYATNNLRFEAGTQFGNQFGYDTLAARPVAVYDLGWLKLKAGGEYLVETAQAVGDPEIYKERGFGGAAQFVIDPYAEFGVNAAYGMVDHKKVDGTTDETGSYDTWSAGGFANVRIVPDLLLGGGFDYTFLVDQQYDPTLGRHERYFHTQTYVALQYLVAKHLFVKVVGAYALARFEPNFQAPIFNDDMWSLRLRLQYLF